MHLLLQQSYHRRFGWLLWSSSISPLPTTPSSPSLSSSQLATLPLSLSGSCCLGFASIREFHQIWAPLDALLYGGRRRRNCFFFLLLASLSTSELLSSLSFALQKVSKDVSWALDRHTCNNCNLPYITYYDNHNTLNTTKIRYD